MAESVGVACVVDSSLSLQAEWPRIMAEYIVPLFQRLYDAGRIFKIAFVCYASSATHPSPLLSKLNFAPPQNIVKDLKDDPARLGVGQTGSGGGRGMAVLEGLVAAVELIDLFKATAEKVTCHIIHVAASPPDAAERPLWNVSPRLDTVTWDSLPQEMQKRDIKYSHVLLTPIGKLTTFHSAVAGAAVQTPWFPVRNHHSVRLSGYPPAKAASGKRPHEPPATTNDDNQDSKRARVLSATQSPKPSSSSQASSPPQTQPTPSPIIPPANPAAAARPTPTPNVTPQAYQKMIEHVAETERQLKAKMVEASNHQRAGRMKEADDVRQHLQPMFASYKRMKLVMDQYRSKVQDQHTQQSGTAAPNAPSSIAAALASLAPTVTFPSTEPTTTIPPSTAPPSSGIPTTTEVPNTSPGPITALVTAPPSAPLPIPPSGPGSTTTPQIPQAPPATQVPTIPPTVETPPVPSQTLNKAQDAQLQKLLEQQRRTPRMTPAVPPSQPSIAPPPSQNTPPQPVIPVPAQGAPVPASAHRWEGTLAWRGLEPITHAKTELQTRVMLASMSNQELPRKDFWPSTWNLQPSKEKAIPWYLSQDWIKRVNCVPFMLQPRDVPGEDKAKNEEHFRALVRLLVEKKIYALSGWPGLEGKEQRVVIFLTKGGLAGAYFADGAPELPAAEICGIELDSVPPHVAYVLWRLPPQQLTVLNGMTMEQRK
ncbi:hypothetical protein EIP91_002523, partial [Steccherinum ochraceum]